MSKLELIATTVFGLEAIAARELKDLGYDRQLVENGKVTFTADELGICRANMWLRCAERVLIKVGTFKALTFEELYQQTKALPWENWLPIDCQFPVNGKSVKSKLFSISDCQAIVKKAIVEKLKETYNCTWFEETGPRYSIEVALLKDIVTLTIDTTGPGLHKRGYRQLTGPAPLKETLAAAMIKLSYWHSDRALIDPFCGTGTIPIEAAFIAQNRAPGLKRDFISEKWPNLPRDYWQETWQEALDLWQKDIPLHIYGSDIDSNSLQLAKINSAQAGLAEKIYFQRLPVIEVRSRFKYGHLITNPPYGERMGTVEIVDKTHKELGEVLKRLETWSLHFLTNHSYPEKLIGKRWDKSRKLYNGRLECHFYQFFGPKPIKRSLYIKE